jgi:autotransporter-associated beta strand protein
LTANVDSGGALIDTNGSSIAIAQSLVHGTGTPDGGLTVLGSGTLTLTGANTYTGPTTVNSGGTLILGGSNALQASALTLNGGGSVVFATTGAAGTFNIGGLSGSSSGVGYDLVLADNASPAFPVALAIGGANANSYAGNLTGPGSLVLNGGTQKLSGNNSYTGATTVNSGTLIVSGSLSGTAGVTVVNGATLELTGLVSPAASGTVAVRGTLTGTGFAGAVSILNAGGVAPGTAATTGTLGVSSLTLGGGSFYTVKVNGVTSDAVNATGAVILGSTNTDVITLNLVLTGQPLGNTAFTILQGASLENNAMFTYAGSYVSNGEVFTVSNNGFVQEFTMSYGSEEDILIAVPEPQGWAMIMSGVGLCALSKRLRRRN